MTYIDTIYERFPISSIQYHSQKMINKAKRILFCLSLYFKLMAILVCTSLDRTRAGF